MRYDPISGKDKLPPQWHGLADDVVAVFGRIRGPFSVLLHRPELARKVLPLVPYFREQTLVDGVPRLIAILSTVREREANYVWAAQVGYVRRNNLLPESTIDLLRAKGDPSGLPEDQRDIVDFCRQLTRTNRVDPALYDRMQQRHGTEWLIELNAAAAFYGMLCHMANAFDIPIPEGEDRFR
jgi:4-carboxymuconolactone decarboxylase